MDINVDFLISGCNTQCKHCYVNGGPGPQMGIEDALTCIEKLDATAQTETAASLTQGTKLFLPPNVEIKAGSKIIVEQDGVKNAYSASGVPAVYPTHQEIILTLFERWA